jgi:hypothetical protein
MADANMKLDANDPNEVASGIQPSGPTFIRLTVGPPDNLHQLLVFSGTAIVGFERPSEDSGGGDTTGFEVVDIILQMNVNNPADFLGASTYCALAAISNDEQPVHGYKILHAGTIRRDDGALRLVARIAVGFSAELQRMSYQAFVLWRALQ